MEHVMSLMVMDFGPVTSIMVTSFSPVTSLSFRDGTCDESDGSQIEPSSEMEPMASELISSIPLISKNLGTICIIVEETKYIAHITTFVINYCYV